MAKSVVDVINSRYGATTMMSGVDRTERLPILLDSGVLSLNLALGTNGFLGGRMGLVWGEKQSGKTLLSTCFATRVQKDNGKVAFLDVEGTFDMKFAKNMGIDPAKLFIISSKDERVDKDGVLLDPLFGEEWIDILIELIKSREYNLIILDSIPALVPKVKMEAATVDQGRLKAASAQLMAEMLPKVNSYLNMNPACFVLFISQERANPMVTYGSNKKAAGGNTAGFFISYEMYARKTESIRRKVPLTPTKMVEEEVAIKVAYRVMKNKVARVNEPAEFIVNLDTGVDIVDDTFGVAKMCGIIKTTGSWFSFGDKKAMGENKFKELLVTDLGLLEEVRAKCVQALINRDTTGLLGEAENTVISE